MTKMNFKNVSFEEMKADFISPNYKFIVSPYKIKRVQKGNDRFYVTMNDDDPTFYLSVTSFASRSINKDRLERWRGMLGNEFADFVADRSAEYGTFLHIEIGEFLKAGKYDTEQIADRVLNYLLMRDIYTDHLFSEWITKTHNDILSFAQFAIDKNLEIVAIEFPIVSKSCLLGGCIDIVCKLDFNKKRVNAIIDNKSGRKGFFEPHELQLKVYQKLWNETFSDIFPVTHVFNWSPKEWQKKPTYHFKNQTKSAVGFEYLIQRALFEKWSEKQVTIIRATGVIELGQDLTNNIQVVELCDFVKGKTKK